MIPYGLPPVASFQFKRCLPTIFTTLVLNVGLDRTLSDADSRGEIANRPERHFTMIDLADEWEFLDHHTPGIRFEDSDGVGDGQLRRNTDQQMYVVVAVITLI